MSDAPSRAPGPVPPGRAARASSWTRPRRCGGSCCKSYAYRPDDATISFGATCAGSRAARGSGDTHRRCPVIAAARDARASSCPSCSASSSHRPRRRSRPGAGRRAAAADGLVGHGRAATDAVATPSPAARDAGRRPRRTPPAVPTIPRSPARGAPRPTAAAGRRLTGYRWPLAARPDHAAVRADAVGRAGRRRPDVPRRHRPGDVLRRPDRGRPRRRRSWPPAAITTTQMGWIGDLAPYYARLDAKKLWTTLPIVVVIDDGNGYRSIYAHFGKIVVKKGQTVTAGTSSATRAGPGTRPAATSITACSARSRRRRSRSTRRSVQAHEAAERRDRPGRPAARPPAAQADPEAAVASRA